MDQRSEEWNRARLAMAAVGAAGGLSFWMLAELLPDLVENDRATLLITLIVTGFFLILMALSGPVRLSRAAGPALALSVSVAGLFLLASFRFAQANAFIETGHPAVALGMIYLVAPPFLSVVLTEGRQGWHDYAALFQTAWTIVVRIVSACLFTGVVWGVIFLSDALLDLVGIDWVERLIQIDAAPFVISGGVLGLALAVAHEWRAYVSPHLLLRLLRLLVPMVVPVMALFLVAVALRGVGNVFNFFSETALLIAVAIGCITLITVSLDRDGQHEVQARVLRWGGRALSVMLFPLAALAVWGIAVRVMDYGWTPQRVLAALCAGMVLLYGVAYAALAVLPGNWGRRLRGVNIALALLSLSLAALWLTPVLNAERIAAQSQLARVLDGRVAPENAALWEMTRRWGVAGQTALLTLETTETYPRREAVLTLIAQARGKENRYDYDRVTEADTVQDQVRELSRLLPLRPEGTTFPEGAFGRLSDWQIRTALEACKRSFDDGSPGCVYLEVPFNPALGLRQGVLLLRRADDSVIGHGYLLAGGLLEQGGQLEDLYDGRQARLDSTAILMILQGTYEIAPAQLNTLRLGGISLFPDN